MSLSTDLPNIRNPQVRLFNKIKMNRLAVSRSARAQQAYKVNNRINQLTPVGTGPFKQHIITYVLNQLLKLAVA